MTTLRRALGRWDLTAIGINQVIGGSIFLLPSQVAVVLGAWSAIAIGLMGIVSLSIALCFAELASRFDGTGGPYLYTRRAFGNFFGFEVGWMQWFTRPASQATIMAGGGPGPCCPFSPPTPRRRPRPGVFSRAP